MIRHHAQSNKKTDLPNGVSRFEEVDRRLAVPKTKVGFGVLIYVNGKPVIKKFRVSSEVSEQVAKTTAIKLRRYYENCTHLGIQVDLNIFNNWKDGRFACTEALST